MKGGDSYNWLSLLLQCPISILVGFFLKKEKETTFLQDGGEREGMVRSCSIIKNWAGSGWKRATKRKSSAQGKRPLQNQHPEKDQSKSGLKRIRKGLREKPTNKHPKAQNKWKSETKTK